jgi:hypothetical protein
MTHARLLLEARAPNDRNRVAFGPKSIRFADTAFERENGPNAPSQGRK